MRRLGGKRLHRHGSVRALTTKEPVSMKESSPGKRSSSLSSISRTKKEDKKFWKLKSIMGSRDTASKQESMSSAVASDTSSDTASTTSETRDIPTTPTSTTTTDTSSTAETSSLPTTTTTTTPFRYQNRMLCDLAMEQKMFQPRYFAYSTDQYDKLNKLHGARMTRLLDAIVPRE